MSKHKASAIAVMKQHGLHEPASPRKIEHAVVQQARSIGIDVETLLNLGQRDVISGGHITAIRAELEAHQRVASGEDWHLVDIHDSNRFRIRAVAAERSLKSQLNCVVDLKEQIRRLAEGHIDDTLRLYAEERESMVDELTKLAESSSMLRSENETFRRQIAEAKTAKTRPEAGGVVDTTAALAETTLRLTRMLEVAVGERRDD